MLLAGVGMITAAVVNDQDPSLSESEAIRIAEDETGGKTISVHVEHELGGPVYEVRVETADGLKEVEIDGDTGKVQEIEDDDGEEEDDDDDDDDDEPDGSSDPQNGDEDDDGPSEDDDEDDDEED